MNFLLKRRRDRWVSKVITVGRQLRQAEIARRGVNENVWPEDCAHMDARIDDLAHKRDALLTKIKETA